MKHEARKMREEISLILIKWSMPTRQAAISQIESLFHSKLMAVRGRVEKYTCDFNWDFEHNKAKHKSYVALDEVLAILDEEMGKV